MERLHRIWAWVKENVKLVLGIISTALLALASIFGLYWLRERRERQRQEALQKVRETGGRADEAEDMAAVAGEVAADRERKASEIEKQVRDIDISTRDKLDRGKTDDLDKLAKEFKDAGL